MLHFKEDYKQLQIDLIVDNARIHTTKTYSLQDFGKTVRTHCPIRQGENKGKSEGLVELCKDLDAQLHHRIKLDEFHVILLEQLAYQNITKLEALVLKYNVNIIFCPKYHYELNAIEGFWCSQKAFVRSRTDQSFEKMIKLISESRSYFVERKLALKLFRHFCDSIEAYSQSQTYADVLE